MRLDETKGLDRGAVLAARAAERGVPCQVLRLPRGDVPALPLLEHEDQAGELVIVVFASARAWKGCAGVSPACRELVESLRSDLGARGVHTPILWCTPRPEDIRDAHVPGSGPHLEAAIADLALGSAES